MAAAVTLVDNDVFCIEEPEIHLHPHLQKKFVKYLAEHTNNQYLITTHSNAFFDLSGVNIYHCWLENGTTQCQLATMASDKHLILSDLGYKPSDILLANFIIWVEGPSDKIYLTYWIQNKAPELVEGLDYTIIFYGGSLLKYYAYDDGRLDEFIQLSKLNRNASIMMDSDRKKPGERLDQKKRRVRDDFENNHQYVWVTKGRTIENYISESVFNDAVAQVHPRTKRSFRWTQFADMTHLRKDKIVDKVAVARKVVEYDADYSVLDLEPMMNKLIKAIRAAED
jgi:predicted ATP-dependent endonuclease of OLD family